MSKQAIYFTKMNGLGNEIIVADMRGRKDKIGRETAVALSTNQTITFDQIMSIQDSHNTAIDAYIDIINADGSDAGACGNGMRCVTAVLANKTSKKNFKFQTVSGILSAIVHDNGQITVDMGCPRFQWNAIPLSEEFEDTRRIELQIGPIDNPILHSPSVVNMGNPHAIFWVDKDLWFYKLESIGPLLENHPVFAEGANISIARVEMPDAINMRIWERGAGATKACGSAACAAAVCAARLGLTNRNVTVTMPGGMLVIEWNDEDRVLMTGPVVYEFSGKMYPATGQWVLETDECNR